MTTPADPRIAAAKKAKDEAGTQLNRARTQLNAAYTEILTENGIDLGNHSIGGFWDCPTSPIKICVYHVSDRCHDDCIYCHDPRERK